MLLNRIEKSLRHERDFTRLMAMYEKIYRQLHLLFGQHYLDCDRVKSTVVGELPLYFEVTERHPFTTCARLTYFIEQPDGIVARDPDAHIRIYHDAAAAEATHCYPGLVSQPLFGALVPVADVVEHRWRTNRFLERWLAYLREQGHGPQTTRPAKPQEWPQATVSIIGELQRLGNRDLAER